LRLPVASIVIVCVPAPRPLIVYAATPIRAGAAYSSTVVFNSPSI